MEISNLTIRLVNRFLLVIASLIVLAILGAWVFVSYEQRQAEVFKSQEINRKILSRTEKLWRDVSGEDVSDLFPANSTRTEFLGQLRDADYTCLPDPGAIERDLDCSGKYRADIGCTQTLHLKPTFDEMDKLKSVFASTQSECL